MEALLGMTASLPRPVPYTTQSSCPRSMPMSRSMASSRDASTARSRFAAAKESTRLVTVLRMVLLSQPSWQFSATMIGIADRK